MRTLIISESDIDTCVILLSLQTLLCVQHSFKQSLFRGDCFIDRVESMMMQISSSCLLFFFLVFGHLAPGVRLSTFGVQRERSESKNVHWLTKKGDEVANCPAYFHML